MQVYSYTDIQTSIASNGEIHETKIVQRMYHIQVVATALKNNADVIYCSVNNRLFCTKVKRRYR